MKIYFHKLSWDYVIFGNITCELKQEVKSTIDDKFLSEASELKIFLLNGVCQKCCQDDLSYSASVCMFDSLSILFYICTQNLLLFLMYFIILGLLLKRI